VERGFNTHCPAVSAAKKDSFAGAIIKIVYLNCHSAYNVLAIANLVHIAHALGRLGLFSFCLRDAPAAAMAARMGDDGDDHQQFD